MDQASKPRIEKGGPMRIAGLKVHYTADTMNQIPAQWERFGPMIGTVPGQIGGVAYGVCFLGAKGIDYLCGVEISANSKTSADLSVVEVPAQTYAVFEHPGHVSTLHETMEAIESKWLPASGCKPVPKAAGAPDFFERYGEEFNPQTGLGGIEVWIPVEAA